MMTTFRYRRLFFNRLSIPWECDVTSPFKINFTKTCTSVAYVIETYALNWPWHNNWHREIDMLQAVIQKKPIYGMYTECQPYVHIYKCTQYAYVCPSVCYSDHRFCVHFLHGRWLLFVDASRPIIDTFLDWYFCGSRVKEVCLLHILFIANNSQRNVVTLKCLYNAFRSLI